MVSLTTGSVVVLTMLNELASANDSWFEPLYSPTTPFTSTISPGSAWVKVAGTCKEPVLLVYTPITSIPANGEL